MSNKLSISTEVTFPDAFMFRNPLRTGDTAHYKRDVSSIIPLDSSWTGTAEPGGEAGGALALPPFSEKIKTY